jgi:hypothetical protein
MITKCSKTDTGNRHNKHNIVECNFAKHMQINQGQHRTVDNTDINTDMHYVLSHG